MPSDTADMVRRERGRAGLSQRALSHRSGVSYPTICRIERGRCDPTLATLERLFAALDLDLVVAVRRAHPGPRLGDLRDAFERDESGVDEPDWTRLRALLDDLERHPHLVQGAIRTRPDPSGSAFMDNLLAGIAEKIADDAGWPRPSWVARVAPLDHDWIAPGTPRMRAADRAATPPQLVARRIFVPERSLWRHRGTGRS